MGVPWTVILIALSSIGSGRRCAVAFREIPMFEVRDNAARRVMRRRLSSCAGFSVLPGSARELDAA